MPFPDCAPGLECVRRALLTITGADKYCRVITPPGALAQEGENCEGFDETTNRPFPSCDQGLVCEYTGGFTIPGQNKICKRPGSSELAQEGDTCEGFNEFTGMPFPSCAPGLEC